MLRKVKRVKLKRLRPYRPQKHSPMKMWGLPVQDAKTPIRLKITDDIIARAKPKDPTCCAAAIAAEEQITGCMHAEVHNSVMYLHIKRGDKEIAERYKTPPGLRSEIVVFDRGGRMAASRFECPPPTARTGRRQGSSAPGARDAGSTDRTPTSKRPEPHYLNDVRPMARAKEG